MSVLAVAYAVISGRGMCYPINLLAAGFFPARSTTVQIAAFHWDSLLIATMVHIVCSLLVGLLYGAALPLRVMAFEPIEFVLAPKYLAALVTVPCLSILSNFCGIIAGGIFMYFSTHLSCWVLPMNCKPRRCNTETVEKHLKTGFEPMGRSDNNLPSAESLTFPKL